MGNVASTVFANGFASLFYAVLSLLYDIRLVGLENYHAHPATLIAINHRRDLDILIIGSFLHLRKTLFQDRLRMHFAARNDLFDSGFLTAHYRLPGLMGELAHKVNITPIMRLLRARPISHLINKRTGPLMRDVMEVVGNLKMEQIVKQVYLDEFARLLKAPSNLDLGSITIADFLGFDYSSLHQEHTDMGILQTGLSSRVRSHAMKMVERQLETLANVLDEGGICLIAPEGHLSYDGKFSPMKSGLHRLLSMTHADARVLPVSTTYDFMTTGRMRIYVTIGKEMVGLKEMNKYDLNDRVKRAIVCISPVTMGQLGSDFILRKVQAGLSLIYLDEVVKMISSKAKSLKASGFRLEDRLLDERSFQIRLHDFISYCLKKHILKKAGSGTFQIIKGNILNSGGCRHWENPVRYSSNEMESLQEICLGYGP